MGQIRDGEHELFLVCKKSLKIVLIYCCYVRAQERCESMESEVFLEWTDFTTKYSETCLERLFLMARKSGHCRQVVVPGRFNLHENSLPMSYMGVSYSRHPADGMLNSSQSINYQSIHSSICLSIHPSIPSSIHSSTHPPFLPSFLMAIGGDSQSFGCSDCQAVNMMKWLEIWNISQTFNGTRYPVKLATKCSPNSLEDWMMRNAFM